MDISGAKEFLEILKSLKKEGKDVVVCGLSVETEG